jgi:diguanylate cyclase (GGDEF)-like protein
MTARTSHSRSAGDLEAEFRAHRIDSLISVNLHTFWSIAIILLAFGLWDFYVDRGHWRTAFLFRALGAAVVVTTGIFQTLPGRARWMPLMAKVRLVAGAASSAAAAGVLNQAYGFGVAGVCVLVLTGPYIAIDTPDLIRLNISVLVVVALALFGLSLTPFAIGATAVFVLLAVAVSILLGRVLETSNRRAFALERELHHEARTDTLTGLDNRRAMQERGRVEMKRSTRSKTPVSVVLADLDHFKEVNDRYGHETGDTVLTKVAAALRAALRESDALGRWGGEEFMAVLPATDARGAAEVAERMRAAIAETTFEGLRERTTISLGVASSQGLDDPGMEWDLLLKEADQRLYRAKHEGRNRVVGN